MQRRCSNCSGRRSEVDSRPEGSAAPLGLIPEPHTKLGTTDQVGAWRDPSSSGYPVVRIEPSLLGMCRRRSGCGRYPRCLNSCTTRIFLAGCHQSSRSTPGRALASVLRHAVHGKGLAAERAGQQALQGSDPVPPAFHWGRADPSPTARPARVRRRGAWRVRPGGGRFGGGHDGARWARLHLAFVAQRVAAQGRG
jgi:hypothetical protein